MYDLINTCCQKNLNKKKPSSTKHNVMTKQIRIQKDEEEWIFDQRNMIRPGNPVKKRLKKEHEQKKTTAKKTKFIK